MNLRIVLLFVASSLLISTTQAQSPAPSLSVDELVAKNIEAKGGAAALKAIQTIRFEGRILVNHGQIQLTYTEIKKRPGKVRTDENPSEANLFSPFHRRNAPFRKLMLLP